MNDRGQRPFPGTGRLEALSDGVLAIAITLLVLELVVPEEPGVFTSDLLHEWPTYLAYLAAFVMIGSVWLHHHMVFTSLPRASMSLVYANLALLLTASLLPFPTAVVSSAFRIGDEHDRVAGVVAFAGISALISLSYAWLCRAAQALVPEQGAGPGVLRGEQRRAFIAVVAMALAIVVAVFAPVAALVLVAVTPFFYLFTFPRDALNAGR